MLFKIHTRFTYLFLLPFIFLFSCTNTATRNSEENESKETSQGVKVENSGDSFHNNNGNHDTNIFYCGLGRIISSHIEMTNYELTKENL